MVSGSSEQACSSRLSCSVPKTAMESSDVDEQVGRSEGFPCHVPTLVVVVIHVFIVVHLGLIRKSERFFHVHTHLFQPLQIIVRLRLLLPHARNEVDNGLDGIILLQLYRFSLVFHLFQVALW